jgi:hypothetical protein
MRFKYWFVVGVAVILLAIPVSAHHSHAQYDLTIWTPIEGTVKQVLWLNPHSWIYLEVKDANGQTTTWALEAAGPRTIESNGVKREDVKVGDKIKVRCHLLTGNAKGCLLGYVTPLHGDAARGQGVEKDWD